MPWHEVSPMELRRSFVESVRKNKANVAAVCRLFGISRKTGYKWLQRADEEGVGHLADRSRRPHSHPLATPTEVVERLVALREERPHWGAKKLLAWLDQHEPGWSLPSASTTTELLKRRGLVQPRRARHPTGTRSTPLAHATAPNVVWAVDFKGDFLVGDGTRCWPLTVTDAYSRYALCCRAMTSTQLAPTRAALERVFREWGLPERLRSDNGTPFGAHCKAPLSSLSVWLVKLGVLPEYTAPGKPQQNGRHERYHRTLKQEACRPPAATLSAQQRRFNDHRRDYNEQRPHEAISMVPPVLVHVPSPRPFPQRVEPPTYPSHYERRRVDANGRFRWRGRSLFLAHTLTSEEVGLVEIEDGLFDVYFGPLIVGRLHERLSELGLVQASQVLPMFPV